eukprot:COSAG01_NODE_1289_length_10885_cov_3.769331_2_plen_276_part_00
MALPAQIRCRKISPAVVANLRPRANQTASQAHGARIARKPVPQRSDVRPKDAQSATAAASAPRGARLRVAQGIGGRQTCTMKGTTNVIRRARLSALTVQSQPAAKHLTVPAQRQQRVTLGALLAGTVGTTTPTRTIRSAIKRAPPVGTAVNRLAVPHMESAWLRLTAPTAHRPYVSQDGGAAIITHTSGTSHVTNGASLSGTAVRRAVTQATVTVSDHRTATAPCARRAGMEPPLFIWKHTPRATKPALHTAKGTHVTAGGTAYRARDRGMARCA